MLRIFARASKASTWQWHLRGLKALRTFTHLTRCEFLAVLISKQHPRCGSEGKYVDLGNMAHRARCALGTRFTWLEELRRMRRWTRHSFSGPKQTERCT